jgi:hypothetical protein
MEVECGAPQWPRSQTSARRCGHGSTPAGGTVRPGWDRVAVVGQKSYDDEVAAAGDVAFARGFERMRRFLGP